MEKRKKAMQSTLDRFFKRKPSLPEASASDEPQPSTFIDDYTRPNVPTPLPFSSSDVNDPDVVQFAPSSSNPLPQSQQARTLGRFW